MESHCVQAIWSLTMDGLKFWPVNDNFPLPTQSNLLSRGSQFPVITTITETSELYLSRMDRENGRGAHLEIAAHVSAQFILNAQYKTTCSAMYHTHMYIIYVHMYMYVSYTYIYHMGLIVWCLNIHIREHRQVINCNNYGGVQWNECIWPGGGGGMCP